MRLRRMFRSSGRRTFGARVGQYGLEGELVIQKGGLQEEALRPDRRHYNDAHPEPLFHCWSYHW